MGGTLLEGARSYAMQKAQTGGSSGTMLAIIYKSQTLTTFGRNCLSLCLSVTGLCVCVYWAPAHASLICSWVTVTAYKEVVE